MPVCDKLLKFFCRRQLLYPCKKQQSFLLSHYLSFQLRMLLSLCLARCQLQYCCGLLHSYSRCSCWLLSFPPLYSDRIAISVIFSEKFSPVTAPAVNRCSCKSDKSVYHILVVNFLAIPRCGQDWYGSSDALCSPQILSL